MMEHYLKFRLSQGSIALLFHSLPGCHERGHLVIVTTALARRQ